MDREEVVASLAADIEGRQRLVEESQHNADKQREDDARLVRSAARARDGSRLVVPSGWGALCGRVAR